MSMKQEFTAHDMATAAADGFRDGQRAAQSAPAGEREAFEAWAASVGYHTERDMFQPEKYQSTLTFELWRVWQARAAWQRTQSAGVPEGFRVMKPTSAVVRDGERWEIYAPCGSGGIVHEDDVTDWVVRKLLDALAAPAQPAAQEGESK